MALAIVLPTYNEKENIIPLITEILRLNQDTEVIVVDDNSPDETYKLVEDFAKTAPHIHLIHRRENRGRGLAGIAGFKYALSLKNVDYILEMDADFSHPPGHILDFLQAIPDGDVVIGSRFIPGGQDTRKSFLRSIISFLARLYIRLICNIPAKDPTSGFRCFKRKALEEIGLETLRAADPSILVETLYRCVEQKYIIKEIPIVFRPRCSGRSKLCFKILMNSLLLPWKLRLSRNGHKP